MHPVISLAVMHCAHRLDLGYSCVLARSLLPATGHSPHVGRMYPYKLHSCDMMVVIILESDE